MGIGTSLGAYFETELDHHAGNELPIETGTGNAPLYLDDTQIPYEGEGTRHDRYREDEPGVLEWLHRDEKNAVKDRDKSMELKPEDVLGIDPTHDNNIMTQDVLYKAPGGLVHKVSDIKTASPLVTITDADIDKGMGLGMSFSGGGLTTTEGKVLQMRKGANDNIPDLVNPNLTPVEQLARKLAETENGKGSWDRIGGGGQEHYWRDAEKALKQQRPSDYDGIQRYNPNEPNMIGSKELDDEIIASWHALVEKQQKISDLYGERAKLHDIRKDRDWSDIDLARFNKIGGEINKVTGDNYTVVPLDKPLKKYEYAKDLDALLEEFKTVFDKLEK